MIRYILSQSRLLVMNVQNRKNSSLFFRAYTGPGLTPRCGANLPWKQLQYLSAEALPGSGHWSPDWTKPRGLQRGDLSYRWRTAFQDQVQKHTC